MQKINKEKNNLITLQKKTNNEAISWTIFHDAVLFSQEIKI